MTSLQYKKVGRWADYLFGERVYVTLSLVAKSLLAWHFRLHAGVSICALVTAGPALVVSTLELRRTPDQCELAQVLPQIAGWVGHHSGRLSTRCLQSRALQPAHFRRANYPPLRGRARHGVHLGRHARLLAQVSLTAREPPAGPHRCVRELAAARGQFGVRARTCPM